MRHRAESTPMHKVATLFTFLIACFLATGATQGAGSNWPQFRGPHASGVSPADAPVTWNIERRENLLWQTPIPGLGHASPILWGNQLLVLTTTRPGGKPDLKIGLYGSGDSFSEKERHAWHLLCLDRQDGRVVWDKTVLDSVPRLERHTKASHCNSTPATDGRRIVAILGSEGLFCFDMDGRELWRKDLGKMDAGPYDAPTLQWGFASSPILHDGKIIVQCDVLSEQFLAVFDASDGREIWRTQRKDVASWSTPIVSDTPARKQVIVNGWKHIGGYELVTGRELWNLREGGDIVVASPVLAGEVAILTSGHGKYRPMRAVRLDAQGDITPPEIGATNQSVVWCHPRKGNYVQTPIVVGNLVWGCHDSGVVTCFDLKTGAVQYEERLGGGGQGFTASPIAAGEHLYFTGEEGAVFVLPTGRDFRVLATNQLGHACLSTPAACEGTLYFRTTDALLALRAPH
jgi:outer membrane protein assembly factor BamB